MEIVGKEKMLEMVKKAIELLEKGLTVTYK